MKLFRTNRPISGPAAAVLAVVLLAAAPAPPVFAGDEPESQATSQSDSGQVEKAVVVPYKKRPAPSHRVSLHDDRVYFLKKLEKTPDGFVLHTMEDEVIEVERSEVAEIVELKKE